MLLLLLDNDLLSDQSSLSPNNRFLGSEPLLSKVSGFLKSPHFKSLASDDQKCLECFEKTFKCYIVTDPEAKSIRQKINTLEAELQTFRNNMQLGIYIMLHLTNIREGYEFQGKFIKASSVQLRNILSTSKDENERKAAYQGLYSIGSTVSTKFCEIVKLRNQFAKKGRLNLILN